MHSPARFRAALRGAISVVGAFWLAMAAICLMAIDIGHVFWQQREVQRIADLAALAGAASNDETSCYANMAANAAQNGLKAPADAVAEPKCGHWSRLVDTSTGAVDNTDAEHPFNAARVTITRQVPYFFVFHVAGPGAASRTVMARATAARSLPLAALNIRSTLAAVDSTKSPLLNAVFGGLLGGSLNLSAAGWQGLVDTNINLLHYLDQLALDLGVAAGRYDQLLATSTSVHALLQAAIEVMQRDGGSSVAVDGLLALQAATPPSTPPVRLGEMMQVQSGTSSAGLDTDMQAYQFAQGTAQLANSKNAAVVDIQPSLLGLAGASVHMKVIEPPQISAIGDPALAKADPYGPNRIFVKTAQVRTLVSIDIGSPLTSLASGLASAVLNLAQPVTDLLNSVLQLDLVAVVGSLNCLVSCTQVKDVTDLQVMPSPIRLDVNLDVAAAQARVTDYACRGMADKSLTVSAQSSASDIRIGKLGTSAADAAAKAFASAAAPAVEPIPLIDIGTKTVRKQCTLLAVCTTTWKKGSSWVSDPALADRQAFTGGGIGLRTDSAVAASAQQLAYAAPPASALPDIDQAPGWQTIPQADIVGSLSHTLAGVDIQMYQPNTEGGLGAPFTGVGSILDSVVAQLRTAISTVLSPLLDPLLHLLLDSLGINLAGTDVGARLSCNQGVDLVY